MLVLRLESQREFSVKIRETEPLKASSNLFLSFYL